MKLSPLCHAGRALMMAMVITSLSGMAAASETQRKAFYIINGEDDGHEAVGALLDSEQNPSCTGTLIAPTVVLTAAHCFESGLQNDSFFIGANANDLTTGKVIPIKSVHLHPQYMIDLEADIAVAILSHAASVRPIPYLKAQMDESWINKSVLFVGYGLQEIPSRERPRAEGADAKDGTRKSTRIPIVEVTRGSFTYASTTTNTCYGDSGGPALASVDGRLTVIGVTSWGDDNCTQFGVNTRTDTYKDFLGQYGTQSVDSGNLPVDHPHNDTHGSSIEETDQASSSDPGLGGCTAGTASTLNIGLCLLAWLGFAWIRRRQGDLGKA